METKLSKLLNFMRNNEWENAIRLAGGWHSLGEHKDAIQRAKSALNNPDFYRQIKKDPSELINIGINAIKARYSHLL